eukprot:TRINITY_DN3084_c0_g2_i1.p1 TRINITY_DN3084_c0_g2~~TRINITY_DN3084_c0_g2_i1.p1  ORF type:complete len:734 (-),score=200.03 TRINITY_DN3084_c0_g2_i1:39-2240(-)
MWVWAVREPQRHRLNRIIFLLCVVFAISILPSALASCTSDSGLCEMSEPLSPPVAAKKPQTLEIHGHKIEDPYHWLKDREHEDEEVLDYLEDENEYTEAKTAHLKKLQDELYHDMLKRIKETDSSVPYQYNGNFYYKRTEEGKQYPIYCRKKGSVDAPEEILLDQNEIAKDLHFCSLGVYDISPDQNILAYSIDDEGDEFHVLYFKDLRTGEIIESDTIEETEYSFEWANDNKTVFYTTMDDANRPDKVWKHVLGTDPEQDEVIFEEKDQRFNLGLSKTLDEKYIFLESSSQVTTEIWFLDANQPNGEFKLFAARKQNIEYEIDHQNGIWWIITNKDGAKNFKLMKVAVAEHDAKREDNWQEVSYRPQVKLDGMEAFKGHLALWEREHGYSQLTIMNTATGEFHRVELPEQSHVVGSGTNAQFDSTVIRFTYSSFSTPSQLWEYDMNTRERKLLKQEEVLGGYDPKDYESAREEAISHDGTKVPVSLVWKKGLNRMDGSNPMLLEAYGSYGVSSDPSFDSKVLCLLDRGFVYGVAHIRGGGEMGRQWYEDGKLLTKRNTFLDFIASARHLIEKKFTSPKRLAITGASAGGLLMGAVMNMAPELFGAIVAEVPFVDAINTMLDPTLPLTVGEYEEWGNPQDKEYYEYMLTYSPYENAKARAYPAMLFTAGLNDPRVAYWEPAKLVAKLRTIKTDENDLLLKTEMEEGHGGASGRYDFLKEIAFNYAFIIDHVGK